MPREQVTVKELPSLDMPGETNAEVQATPARTRVSNAITLP